MSSNSPDSRPQGRKKRFLWLIAAIATVVGILVMRHAWLAEDIHFLQVEDSSQGAHTKISVVNGSGLSAMMWKNADGSLVLFSDPQLVGKPFDGSHSSGFPAPFIVRPGTTSTVLVAKLVTPDLVVPIVFLDGHLPFNEWRYNERYAATESILPRLGFWLMNDARLRRYPVEQTWDKETGLRPK